ncbi:hypothetical protein FCL47_22290 [Desulfopila sp. IMCC35006]|uniref:hypothetical protein n=1 Tax=Desulfopila sp. IMCC35006 TaxID=2569542 RepID=UPI0010ACD9C9|nr:hypothetical protein [Desulfopila sp. IMCC35006]TKB23487.1 hypothetical protein FCL47_22290 [Desulfopila sp. IMCC35006]
MGSIEKLFDTYSLNARVKPAFMLVFPIVIALFTLFEPSRSWGGGAVTFIVSFGIISLAANQMSTKGNILQERLFGKWGGAPTTIILRHSDLRLDKHTKSRYMARLQELIPNFLAVSVDQECNDKNEADQMYRTAANYLREHTRDTKKYPLVFKENISYGFSRNARAFKWLGTVISFFSLCVSVFVIWYRNAKGSDSSLLDLVFRIPFEQTALVLLLLSMLLIWIFFVTEKWVEVRAFTYAKALFASCEKLI